MRIHHGALAAFTLTMGLLACGDDPASPENESRPCTDDTGMVDVTLTSGQAPSFEWDPPCSVAMLLVEEEGSDMWGIGTDQSLWDDPLQANLIVPPVTYGVVRQEAAPSRTPCRWWRV